MKRIVTLGVLALCLALIAADNDGRAKPRKPDLTGTWGFHLDGLEYVAKLEKNQACGGPDWAPSKPLPLSFVAAEKIARGEIRNLVNDEPTWQVSNLELNRVWGEPPLKWHYVVKFKPMAKTISDPHRLSTIVVLVDFNGKPGTIERGRAPE